MKNILNKNKVFIVRHGQSIWNHDSKFTGWTNIPLTNNGKNEAKQIVKVLKKNNYKPDVYFSSVLQRAVDTANIIKNGFDDKNHIYTSWRLNEKHYGTLEGVPRQYIRKEYGDKFTTMMRSNFYMKPPIINNENIANCDYPVFKNCYFHSIKNGESKENVLQRLLPYFENDILYSFTENKIPMIITHKHCLRVLLKHYLKLNDEEFENFEIPSKNIVIMEFNNNLHFTKHDLISY